MKESNSIQIRLEGEHRVETVKVNLGTNKRPKNLNVFVQISGLLWFGLQILREHGKLPAQEIRFCRPHVFDFLDRHAHGGAVVGS
ncbi:MAG TPA: hypothetical protein VKS01_01990 [Bryobacteraceae bacterium]|nr:hypothetical protein [Bryobacteraceae bacterium]